MTKAQGSTYKALVTHNSIGSLNEVLQQTADTQGSPLVAKRSGTITCIPFYIMRAPDIIALILCKVTVHVYAVIVALHVAADIEDVTHQGNLLYTVSDINLVIEDCVDETLWMDEFLAILINHITTLLDGLLNLGWCSWCQIVLEAVAHIVMNPKLGIEGGKLLALCHHRHDTTLDNSTAGIHLTVLGTKDSREALCHTLAYAMMLTLANSGEVACTLIAANIELLYIRKQLLAGSRQLTQVASLTQRHKHIIRILAVAT